MSKKERKCAMASDDSRSIRPRCGWCDQCIDRELLILSMMEEALYEESEGDTTRYLNLMAEWIDHFNEEGLK